MSKSKSGLYGDNIFIKEDASMVILGILGAIYTLFAIIIACLVKKGNKEVNDVKNALCTNEVQKQLRKIFDAIVSDIKKNKEFKKYNKYFECKVYSFFRKDIQIITKNNNTKVIVPIPVFSIDLDKIFEDVYGMDAADYNKDRDDPDCCRPAPKVMKVLREMDRTCKTYIATIKNGKHIGLDLHIEPKYGWDDIEMYYDSYTFADSQELLAILEFYFDYNELKKKAEEAKNNPIDK